MLAAWQPRIYYFYISTHSVFYILEGNNSRLHIVRKHRKSRMLSLEVKTSKLVPCPVQEVDVIAASVRMVQVSWSMIHALKLARQSAAENGLPRIPMRGLLQGVTPAPVESRASLSATALTESKSGLCEGPVQVAAEDACSRGTEALVAQAACTRLNIGRRFPALLSSSVDPCLERSI